MKAKLTSFSNFHLGVVILSHKKRGAGICCELYWTLRLIKSRLGNQSPLRVRLLLVAAGAEDGPDAHGSGQVKNEIESPANSRWRGLSPLSAAALRF